MINLKDILKTNEKIIEQFSRIEYQNQVNQCVVTNFRTILYKSEKNEYIVIDHSSVNNINLEKAWYIDLVYLIPISLCLSFICLFISLITYFPLSFTPANIDLLRFFLYPGILFMALGIGALYIYRTRVKFSIILSVSKKTFQLFSDYQNLLTITEIIKDIKSGKKEMVKPQNPLEYSKYQMLFSKIVIGIATIFFILVGWFGPLFQGLFYIPFLLLIVGFLIALSSYNKIKIKPIRFKLGFLLMFIGMNFTWFLIYIDILPSPGLITLIIGVGLFFYC